MFRDRVSNHTDIFLLTTIVFSYLKILKNLPLTSSIEFSFFFPVTFCILIFANNLL